MHMQGKLVSEHAAKELEGTELTSGKKAKRRK